MSVDSLHAALSGLRASQRQMGLISTNIANATTPGYTRKILPLTDFAVNGESIGVVTGQIRRQVNTTLQFDLYAQTSLSKSTDAQLKYLKEIQSFHGNPNDETALPTMLQQIGNDFAALADSPTSPDLLSATVSHAQDFAVRVNKLSDLYTRLRNDVQSEMQDSVTKINGYLQQINDLNNQIARNINIGMATADLEDQRDLAVTNLSEQIDISYYSTGDGRLYIQTRQGHQLVDVLPRYLNFDPGTLGVASAYPASAAGIYIDNPTSESQDFEITTTGLGGRLGGLLELRDDTLPRYQASLDEMAQKVAVRFEEQGLTLFTDSDGRVPDSVAPPAATNYTGFSQIMQVNSSVLANPELLRQGTEGETLPNGSAKIINRVVQYTFGVSKGEIANGTADISAATDLFTILGIATEAKVTGVKNIEALGSLDNSSAIVPGTQDTFSIQLGAGTPATITINAGDTATDLVATINTAFPGLASISATGRLVLKDDEAITLNSGTLGAGGFEALGLTDGTTAAENPSFTVQLDDGAVTTIPITATDTSTQLLAKLNAIAGLHAELTVPGGTLQLSTEFGTDIKLSDGLGTPLAKLGVTVSNIAHDVFRNSNLGPGGNISSNISGADSLVSYSQRLISVQATEASTIYSRNDVNETYRATLEQQLSNESGVNLDEEMGHLVVVQQMYGANAKMISASIKMLEDLMDAI